MTPLIKVEELWGEALDSSRCTASIGPYYSYSYFFILCAKLCKSSVVDVDVSVAANRD
jgi:hypothetical protein